MPIMAASKPTLVKPRCFINEKMRLVVRPVCPGLEGDGPGMWAWDLSLARWMYTVSDEDMARGRRERVLREKQAVKPLQLIKKTSSKEMKEFICEQVTSANERQLVRILRALRFICHPDQGGSHEAMIKLNKLYDSLKDA